MDILLCKLKKFEFSNGMDSPILDPRDPSLDSHMCRLIKTTASPLLHEPFERGGGGGINVSIPLCFNTCIAFKNHTFHMKCSICLIWNVSKDNKERKLQFDYKDYKLHWNILASFIPLCLHAVNINSVIDERSKLFYYYIGYTNADFFLFFWTKSSLEKRSKFKIYLNVLIISTYL